MKNSKNTRSGQEERSGKGKTANAKRKDLSGSTNLSVEQLKKEGDAAGKESVDDHWY
jgi:hypothetical protein